MSDKPLPLWERFRLWLAFKVARWAMRLGGPENIYWTNPAVWEEYMRNEGEGQDTEIGVCPGCGGDIGGRICAGLAVPYDGHMFCCEACLELWMDALQDKADLKYEEEDYG
jgi:hypothetical protein